MALTKDDLQFVVSLAPDTKAMEKALMDLAGQVDKASKEASPGYIKNLFSAAKDVKSLLLSSIVGGPGVLGQAGGVVGGAVAGAPGAIAGGAVGRGLEAVPGIIGGVVGALAEVPVVLLNIKDELVGFAAKASPAVFSTWTKALDDAEAVIGQAFIPVLELMRDGVRMAGDTLANFLPNMTEVRGALEEFRAEFDAAGSELRSVLAELGPQVREFFIDGLRELSHWLAIATRAVVMMGERLRQYFGGGAAAKAGGEAGGELPGLRTSFGAAARPAAMEGIEEYERKLQLSAFQIPGQSKEDQQLSRLQDLVNIDTEAKDFLAKMDSTWETLKSVFMTGADVASQSLVVLRAIGTGIDNLVNNFKAIREFLTPSDKMADKIASVMNTYTGVSQRGSVLDYRRAEMKKSHPEYFTGGR